MPNDLNATYGSYQPTTRYGDDASGSGTFWRSSQASAAEEKQEHSLRSAVPTNDLLSPLNEAPGTSASSAPRQSARASFAVQRQTRRVVEEPPVETGNETFRALLKNAKQTAWDEAAELATFKEKAELNGNKKGVSNYLPTAEELNTIRNIQSGMMVPISLGNIHSLRHRGTDASLAKDYGVSSNSMSKYMKGMKY